MKQHQCSGVVTSRDTAGCARVIGACVEFGSMGAQRCWPRVGVTTEEKLQTVGERMGTAAAASDQAT